MSGSAKAVGVTTAVFAQPVAAFIDYLRYEKRYSPNTCAAAQRDLTAFAGHCERAGIRALAEVDTHLVRSFVSAQHRAGRQPSTLHRYLSMLRSFFRYQLRQGQMSANPAQTVRAPKMRRKLPAVIGVDVLNAALDQTPEGDFEVRDHAIVELFYSAGLRLAELQGLNLIDLAGSHSEITITGKGGKQRVVMIGTAARAAIAEWLRVRGNHANAGESALFVSARGGRLSREAIGGRLKRWAGKTGLGVNLHPHRLRHSFATHMLESSGNLRGVQELLGHAHLSTTQIYTHLDWKRLAAVYDDAHPRARKTRR